MFKKLNPIEGLLVNAISAIYRFFEKLTKLKHDPNMVKHLKTYHMFEHTMCYMFLHHVIENI